MLTIYTSECILGAVLQNITVHNAVQYFDTGNIHQEPPSICLQTKCTANSAKNVDKLSATQAGFYFCL